MIVKKYEAPTMQKALEAVKRDLGKDAVILHTKTKRQNGLLGLWGKEMVEITASRDVRVREEARATTGSLLKYYKKTLETEQAGDATPASTELKKLQDDMCEVKTLVASLMKRIRTAANTAPPVCEELLDTYLMLAEQHVTDELAQSLLSSLEERLSKDELAQTQVVEHALTQTIAGMMTRIEPITLKPGGCTKVAFVGPTGVGKTTTIAKLAADFALRQKKKVALVTLDTYRIAAVEQLRTYAEIMNVPLEVVLTPHEVQQAINKHAHCDVILIDTAGRSQKNAAQLQELKAFMTALHPDETHLVLSTTAEVATVENILNHFQVITIDKVIFTKLDEAVHFGLILNVVHKLNKTLSYVTTGQNVPEDIAVTNPIHVANLIVAGDSHVH